MLGPLMREARGVIAPGEKPLAALFREYGLTAFALSALQKFVGHNHITDDLAFKQRDRQFRAEELVSKQRIERRLQAELPLREGARQAIVCILRGEINRANTEEALKHLQAALVVFKAQSPHLFAEKTRSIHFTPIHLKVQDAIDELTRMKTRERNKRIDVASWLDILAQLTETQGYGEDKNSIAQIFSDQDSIRTFWGRIGTMMNRSLISTLPEDSRVAANITYIDGVGPLVERLTQGSQEKQFVRAAAEHLVRAYGALCNRLVEGLTDEERTQLTKLKNFLAIPLQMITQQNLECALQALQYIFDFGTKRIFHITNPGILHDIGGQPATPAQFYAYYADRQAVATDHPHFRPDPMHRFLDGFKLYRGPGVYDIV
ncbi:MAG: hypothetical protein WC775_05325 [Patescibacteria group bacterium]|jgi:hypothetical protein